MDVQSATDQTDTRSVFMELQMEGGFILSVETSFQRAVNAMTFFLMREPFTLIGRVNGRKRESFVKMELVSMISSDDAYDFGGNVLVSDESQHNAINYEAAMDEALRNYSAYTSRLREEDEFTPEDLESVFLFDLNEDFEDPDEDPSPEEIAKRISAAMEEVKNGEARPIEELWEGIDDPDGK